MSVPAGRAQQKAGTRQSLMRAAARLFADRGFAAVTTVELGDAAGVSGPALYKHFSSKEALLVAVLLDASERLLDGGRLIVGQASAPAEMLRRLIAFHLDFATSEPDVIRLQDRELALLPADARHTVRRLQREYVQEWDRVLSALRPEMSEAERQTRLLATFGLLNSTPHSAVPTGVRAGAILAEMAERALLGVAAAMGANPGADDALDPTGAAGS